MRRLQETNSLGKRNGIVMSVQMAMVRPDISWAMLADGSSGVKQSWNVTQGNQVESMSAGPSFYLCHVQGRCGSWNVEIIAVTPAAAASLFSIAWPLGQQRPEQAKFASR